MKKNHMLALVLSLSLLAGCQTAAPTGTPAAGHEDDMVYRTIGVTRDTPLLTVDGAEISAEKTLFWLTQGVESWLTGAGISLEDDWTQPYGSTGMTIAEAIKADALSTTKFYQIIENKALEVGVVPTAEEEQALTDALTKAIEQSGGEETFQQSLDQMCISRAGFEELNRVSYLYELLQTKLAADGTFGDGYTMEDFLAEYGIYAAKHILISTRRINADGTGYEDFSDEEKAEAKAKADDLRAQLAAAGDSATLFDELMNEYSEDGRDSSGNLYFPQGYTYVYSADKVTSYDQTAMVPEFEEGTKALQVGEISQPVQSDYGYHIILRIDVDTAGQAAADMLSAQSEKWMTMAKVETTPAYDELDVKEFYRKLQTLREELAPQETPQPSAEPSPAN